MNEGQGHEPEPGGRRVFHGLSGGELIAAEPDEDGVLIRTDFRATKLAATTARELARHLIACADRADDWMAEASDLGEPEYDPDDEMNEYRVPEPWECS